MGKKWLMELMLLVSAIYKLMSKVQLPCARIPVSSPYIEVRMDTSGTYALIKARTDTSEIYAPT